MKLKTLLKGGLKYSFALATGDRAPKARREHRVAICAACPSGRESRSTKLAGVTVTTCGDPGEETPTTCGCVVAVTKGGRVIPAGKTRVGSEKCPQGKW